MRRVRTCDYTVYGLKVICLIIKRAYENPKDYSFRNSKFEITKFLAPVWTSDKCYNHQRFLKMVWYNGQDLRIPTMIPESRPILGKGSPVNEKTNQEVFRK